MSKRQIMSQGKCASNHLKQQARRRAIRQVVMEDMEPRWLLSGGGLDTTFATNGVGIGNYNGDSTEATSTYVMDNGQVLMAGTVWTSGEQKWAVARFNADGTLDKNFGVQGWALAHVNTNGLQDDDVVGLTVDGGGGIIVAGNTFVAADGGYDTALVRFNADGTWDNGGSEDSNPDDAFGTAGIATSHFDLVAVAHARAVGMQGNNIILAADGGANGGNGYVVARYTDAGVLDPTFGNDGWNSASFLGNYSDDVYSMAIADDGSIVLAGDTVDQSFTYNYGLAKFTSGGAVDTNFGTNGLATFDPVNGPAELASGSPLASIALDAAGNIVAGGMTGTGLPFLTRFDRSGGIDGAFGIQTPALPDGYYGGSFNNVLVQADSQILAAGVAYGAGNDTLLARYGIDATLDATFGTDGVSLTPLSSNYQPAGAAFQTVDGVQKLIVGGAAPVVLNPDIDPYTTQNSFIVARFDLGTGSTPVNTPPTILSLQMPATAVRGFDVSLSASFADPDAGETYAITWDFGDGSTLTTTSATQGSISASHAYAANGSYVVSVTVSDGQDQATQVAAAPIVVQSVGIVAGNLLVAGNLTSANAITITAAAGGLSVYANGNAGTFNPTGDIVIHGGNAGNVIVLATNVTRNAMIFGGAGIDLIRGGSGSNIIVGGGGLDLLVGGSSRDLLIGGDGSDLIVGNASDDILIAGTTAYDNNPVALKAILAEWLRTDHTYAQRVNNLRDGSGTADRSNGSYFLRAEAANPGDATVFDDGNMDIMSGNAGTDWFLFNKDSGVRDLVTDRSSSEFADDIDFINQP